MAPKAVMKSPRIRPGHPQRGQPVGRVLHHVADVADRRLDLVAVRRDNRDHDLGRVPSVEYDGSPTCALSTFST